MSRWWQDESIARLGVHVPCQWACPALVRVPAYVGALVDGDPVRARDINVSDVLLPGVLGRICTRPCEAACRHGREGFGEPVAICSVKRSAADQAEDAPWPSTALPGPAPSGKSVAVVGGGPAGLAVARGLAARGHRVVLLEARDECGGLPRFAIPAFRLPPDVTRREVREALAGVEVRTGVALGRDVSLDDLRSAHDAVVLALGCPVPRSPGLPGESLPGVHAGLPFVLAANAGSAPPLGDRVVVLGGGFTAVDCARLARRMGARDVTVACRRDREDTHWREEERLDLLAEGVVVQHRLAPLAFEGEGRVQAVRLARTRVEVDPSTGRRVARILDDAPVVLPADSVIVALGQIADPALPLPAVTDPGAGLTACPGVFASGDLALGTATVVEAVGHGLRLAVAVDAFLRGRPAPRPVLVEHPCGNTTRPEAWNDLPRVEVPGLPVAERLARPDTEADPGLPPSAAADEAKRCYLCDLVFRIEERSCVFCDKCPEICPVRCIHYTWDGQQEGSPSTLKRIFHLGRRGIVIDDDPCIRCGACVEVCPVSCIHVSRVERVLEG